jgi:flagellar motor switch protein FliG
LALSRARKAAILLTSLDPVTAAELLKATRPDLLTEIAAEIVSLESAGPRAHGSGDEPVKDFFTLVARPKAADGNHAMAARRLVEGAVGKQRSEEVLSQAKRIVDSRDPFRSIRDAAPEELAQALAGEHPQVAALILMEVTPAKSAVLIQLLDQDVRFEAIRRMTGGDNVPPEAKVRVAALVRSRLTDIRKQASGGGVAVAAAATPGGVQFNPRLRQVAVLLRTLSTELRDGLVKAIAEGNTDAAKNVQDLMVMWDDLPMVGERNLQEVLRNVDARKLALSLIGADPDIAQRIRANISERARAMIDEEAQLMKKPRAEEIEAAREAILGYLRQLNSTGDLQFEGA